MGMFNMQPIIRSATGKVYPDTKAGRAQMDQDEGRQRMPNSGMEALIVLRACVTMARKSAENIAPFIKKTGAGRMLKANIGGMRKSVEDIFKRVSSTQVCTLEANTQLQHISVSSGKVPAMINIDVEDLTHICNRALEMCAFSCACTREESKECRLRQAFEQVASSCVEAVRDDSTKCPYAGTGFEIEVE